jgi:phosphoglycerol transferase MdoB-like AlkP superfamily enzyme
MGAESGLGTLLLAALAGLLVSGLIETGLAPRPQAWRRRPAGCLALHTGLWLAAYALLVLLLGRPWFAMAAVSAFLMLTVLVGKAKFASLREAFIFQDFEYFSDALRHPRLYLPFLGWGRAFAAGLGIVAAIGLGWGLEHVPPDRWTVQIPGALGLVAIALGLIGYGNRAGLQARFDPNADVREFGLLACLWCYARAERAVQTLPDSPFAAPPAESSAAPPARSSTALPHLLAIQSESFFDPRPVFSGIRPDVLAGFDAARAEALASGSLKVPAWGANTVRTEFAFLSGLAPQALGVHRFNPYRRLARGAVATLASHLRARGYRTICVHPYPASFYARDRVYPLLGFDEFVDIAQFNDAQRAGPYIGDAAVAEQIERLLQSATQPVFIFAITMENHGPLHLEQVDDGDHADLYDAPPPAGSDDLTIYLRHLRNADRMLRQLQHTLRACDRPASLCWYGDHVPIMAEVYRTQGEPPGQTEYLIWSNRECAESAPATPCDAHALAETWLAAMGLLDARLP